MGKPVAKPPVEQSKAVADTAGADLLASQAAGDQDAKDQLDAQVTAILASSTEVPAAEIEAAGDLKGPEVVTFVIIGPALGRWRIGRKFGPESVRIPASELTEAEAQALQNDPELMVSTVDTRD